MKRYHKGFTLIELLVVIAIIGVLSTMVLSSINSARSNARDAKREQDIKTIQNALELYYVDHGTYPTTSWVGSHNASWGTLGTTLGLDLPTDPINESSTTTASAATSGNYVYSYFAHPNIAYCSGQAYMLVYNKENSNGTGPTDGVRFCNGSGYGYDDAFVVGVSPRAL